MPAMLKQNGWTAWHAAGALALVAGGVALTDWAWQDMFHMATKDEESSHILLVGIAVPWLIWAHRRRVAGCRFAGTWVGPLIVAAGWAMHIYGYDHAYDALWHYGAVLVAVGCLLSFFGRDVLLRFLPVFIVLVFLLPVPARVRAYVGLPLQTAMATITEYVCHVAGIVIDRSGNVLTVGDRRIEVVEACNGMRMVYGLFLVAFTFAFAHPLRWPVRALILLAMPLFALLCNVIRMIPTVLLYGHASEGVAESFHDAAGYLMIIVAVLMLMGTLKLLSWVGVPVIRADHGVDRKTPGPPGARPSGDRAGGGRRLLLSRAVGPVLTVVLLLAVAESVESRQAPDDVVAVHERVRRRAEQIPRVIDGRWFGKDTEVPVRVVEALNPNVMICRRYESLDAGQSFTLLLIHCSDARDLAHHYPPICYPANGWKGLGARSRVWAVEDRRFPVIEHEFEEKTYDRRDRIVIASVLTLPDGGFATDMEPVYALASDPFMRFYGAGQLQLIFDASVPEQQREAAFRAFVGANLELLDYMTAGVTR